MPSKSDETEEVKAPPKFQVKVVASRQAAIQRSENSSIQEVRLSKDDPLELQTLPKAQKEKKSVRFKVSDEVCQDSLPTKDEDQIENQSDVEYDEEDGSQSKEDGDNSSV